MTNTTKYNRAFCEVFALPENTEEDSLKKLENWDSILHVMLITKLEEVLDIMFEPEEIRDFTTYEKGLEIIKRHNAED